MDISGKLIKILPAETGNSARGTWKKQAFVIETTNGQFPKKVCFQTWGDKVDLSRLTEGEEVRVFFDPESREFKEKWYTDLTAWKVEPAQNQNPNVQPPVQQPFAPAPTEVPPFADSNSEKDDDLPF